MLNEKPAPFKEEKKTQARDILENVSIETAAAREEAEEFDWILPEIDPEPREFIQANQKEKNKHPFKTSVKKGNMFHTVSSLLFSLAFAIGLGIAFGIILLKFISAEDSQTPAEANNPTATSANQAPPANASASLVKIPAMTVYVIQGGVFSNQEAADTLVSQLDEKGIPSVIIENNDSSYTVLLGLASNENEAKQLAAIYAEKEVEVYAKEQSLKEGTFETASKGNATVLNEAISSLPILFDITGKAALGQGVPEDAQTKLSQISSSLQSTEFQDQTSSLLADIILQASTSLETFSQSKNVNDAYQAQQVLLSYIKLNHEIE